MAQANFARVRSSPGVASFFHGLIDLYQIKVGETSYGINGKRGNGSGAFNPEFTCGWTGPLATAQAQWGQGILSIGNPGRLREFCVQYRATLADTDDLLNIGLAAYLAQRVLGPDLKLDMKFRKKEPSMLYSYNEANDPHGLEIFLHNIHRYNRLKQAPAFRANSRITARQVDSLLEGYHD